MRNNTAVNFRNPVLVRKAGLSALRKELGAVGAAYFMRQLEPGQGDYTAERDSLLAGITLDELIRSAREVDVPRL